MRVIVLLTLLINLSGWAQAQPTYFNMRYPIANQWGGGTRSIAYANNKLFVNMGGNFDGWTNKNQLFTSINLTTGSKTDGVLIYNDSSEFFSGSLISHSNGGIYDIFTIPSLNQPIKYGVIKYATNGDTIFFKQTLENSLFISVLDVKESHSSGLIFTGIVRTIPISQNGTHDIILVHTDSLGNEQWRKTLGDSIHYEQGYSVATTPDGGYIIGGIQSDTARFGVWDSRRPWLIKTNALGEVEWDKLYGPQDTFSLPIYGVTPTLDGGYAFVGGIGVEQYTYEADYLPWIVKVNALGDTIWTRTIYGNGPSGYFAKYNDILELPDGSLVVCGQQIIPNPDSINFDGPRRITGVITKYSANGDLIWSRNYSHPGNNLSNNSEHNLNSIVATPDGGFAAAGWLFPYPPDTGTQDTWVIKVDSFGCLTPGCEVTSVPKIEGAMAQLKIYPNPASDVLNIEITPSAFEHRAHPEEFELKLYDILGKLVLTKKLFPSTNTIDVSNLKTGVYSYRIGEVSGFIVVQ